MYGQVSKRSMYDMEELRSICQKMFRNPRLLPNGWKEFLYYLDEYFKTMCNDPSKLMLFLVEDKARCPLKLLERVTDVLQVRDRAKIDDYRKVSTAIARQPVDRSAAYLSVACLDLVSPLGEDEQHTLVYENGEKWQGLLDPDTDLAPKWSFAVCMSFMFREVRAVPYDYPMTSNTALRLAAAVSRLVGWDSMYHQIRLEKATARETLKTLLGCVSIDSSIRTVRPLVLGFFVVNHWLKCAFVDPWAEEYCKQYMRVALACCSNPSARLDLVIMNTLLVLMGRFPDGSAPDFLSENLPCDPREIPDEPRVFSMPDVSQDRHTRRGRSLTDTTESLRKHCKQKGKPVPDNIEYSHGRPSHTTRQGFHEFMEHIRLCEQQMSDEKEPVFKEAAMRLYLSLPPGVKKKRMEILKRKLQMSSEAKTKGVSGKRKAATASEECLSEKKRRCEDWIRARTEYAMEWQALVTGCVIGQKPTGQKPPVFIQAERREAIKGPLVVYEQALNAACMNRLARETLGLDDCIPDVRLFVTSDGKIGLASPLIGHPGGVSGDGLVSSNAARGLCKLHEYMEGWAETLTNPMDVLRIIVAKNIVGSTDNNTSNILIERETKRVYGVDLGGQRKKALKLEYASFQWALSRSTSRRVLQQLEALIKRYAVGMVEWLQSVKREENQRRWLEVMAEYPIPVAIPDFHQSVDLFLDFFQKTPLK